MTTPDATGEPRPPVTPATAQHAPSEPVVPASQPASETHPYPFTPTVREPWINPRKRRTAALAAGVGALVLLGGGFGVGATAFGSGHDGGGRGGDRMGFAHPNGPGQQGPGSFGGPAGRHGGQGHRPLSPPRPSSVPSTIPTPSVSPTR